MSLKIILKKTKAYELGLAQMLAVKTAGNQRNTLLEQYNLSSIEWFILGLICNDTPRGGVRVTDLAATLDVKTTYVTSVLRSLKDKGLVQLRRNPLDARERLVVITPEANTTINTIEEDYGNTIDLALRDRVTEEQFRSFIHVTQEIIRAQEAGRSQQN